MWFCQLSSLVKMNILAVMGDSFPLDFVSLTCRKTTNLLTPFVPASRASSSCSLLRHFCSARLRRRLSTSCSSSKVSDRPQLWRPRIRRNPNKPPQFHRNMIITPLFISGFFLRRRNFYAPNRRAFATTGALCGNNSNVDTRLPASILGLHLTVNVITIGDWFRAQY